jgi:hypothetical protein
MAYKWPLSGGFIGNPKRNMHHRDIAGGRLQMAELVIKKDMRL